MSFTSAGVRVWDSTEAASVHGASQAMGASINERIVSTFATTTARDAAFSSLTSAQKAGIICWIVNREGHCYWDPTGNKWQWVSVHRLLANLDQLGNQDLRIGDGYTAIIDPPALTLPPGNRLISVAASIWTQSLDNTSTVCPGLAVTGTGMGTVDSSNARIQGFIPPSPVNMTLTLSRTWQFIVSGQFDIVVYAINRVGGYCRMNTGRLDITDLGPSDG